MKELQLLGNRQRRIGFGVEEGIKLLNLITTLLIWGYAAYLIAAGNMTVGWFVAIVSYIGLLHRKFNWMLRIALDWYARKVSIDRVAEMLEVESEDPSGQPVPPPGHGRVPEGELWLWGRRERAEGVQSDHPAREKIGVVGGQRGWKDHP